MDIENNEIYGLIARSFSGELTDEELFTLNSWKSDDKLNLLEYNDFKEIWNYSNRMAMPSQIDLQKSLATTRKKAGIDSRQIKWLPVFAQSAAILVLAIILSSLYNLFLVTKPHEKNDTIVYQKVKASYGTQSRVDLADGSIVYLNSGSSLRFPNSFDGMKVRDVELIGEGHFEVKKNNGQPFIVEINNLQVKVLGTIFNIDAYPDNMTTTIALVEGSIKLQHRSGENVTDLLEMKPNQVAIFKQSENKMQCKDEDDLSKYTAWTQGKIVFSDDPVNTVIQKLSNWYNVDIVIADKKLEKYRFTGTFIDEPLEQVLSILNRTSQMQFEIIPAQKLNDNSFSKRKIILKSI